MVLPYAGRHRGHFVTLLLCTGSVVIVDAHSLSCPVRKLVWLENVLLWCDLERNFELRSKGLSLTTHSFDVCGDLVMHNCLSPVKRRHLLDMIADWQVLMALLTVSGVSLPRDMCESYEVHDGESFACRHIDVRRHRSYSDARVPLRL